MKKILVVGLLLMLAVASGIQWSPETRILPGKGRHLISAMPIAQGGWGGRELPLGANEAIKGAVEKTLRFDDVYFREFRSGTGVVSLFIAYWNPGAVPVQLVASHYPDRCWVENGWKIEEARHDETLAGKSGPLRPGEWRIFSAPDHQRLQVFFWHLVGTETYNQGQQSGPIPSAWRWWREAAKQAIKTPPEQYFIRLTSNRPFAELQGDPGWEDLLGALAKLGLGVRKPKAEGG